MKKLGLGLFIALLIFFCTGCGENLNATQSGTEIPTTTTSTTTTSTTNTSSTSTSTTTTSTTNTSSTSTSTTTTSTTDPSSTSTSTTTTSTTNTSSTSTSTTTSTTTTTIIFYWKNVGAAGFSSGKAYNTSLYVYNSTPYVAFIDNANNNKATVMRFDGYRWTTVGRAGFSPGAVRSPKLYIDNGIPYIAFLDNAHEDRVTVMQFSRNSWTTVGNAGFVPASDISFYIYDQTPYVASTHNINKKVTVMRFDGSDWIAVGNTGFSPGQAGYISLYIDRGSPYVAFTDINGGNRAMVMKYYSSAWHIVGNNAASTGAAWYTSLFVENGTPYVAFSDGLQGNKATVMKIDTADNRWEPVADPGFSEGAASDISLYVDNRNSLKTPYVAFIDHARGNKATVMNSFFNNTWWKNDGNPGFSEGEVSSISLYIDKVDQGKRYVAFGDHANGDKATVMQFGGDF